MYYKGNGIYEELLKNNIQQYKFVTGNEWQLVYGNADCEPQLLVYLFGKNKNNYDTKLNNKEIKRINFYTYLSSQTAIPYLIIKFRIDIVEVEEVLVSTDGHHFITKNMTELMSLFASHKLPISNSTTQKYLNDKTSSAYHKWQRNSLGRDLKVSDIDLYKVDTNNLPTTIYELKRSYYSLDKWIPFKEDYTNFKLLSKLCNKCNLNLQIIYNVRHKSPFFDDVSKLKLFSVNFTHTPPIKFDCIISFADFIKI